MQIQPGTTFNITVILLLEQSHSLAASIYKGSGTPSKATPTFRSVAQQTLGGQLGPFGADLTIAHMIDLGARQTTILQLQGIQAGLGLVGSASLTCVMAFNFATAQSMNGATNDGYDLALSLGQK